MQPLRRTHKKRLLRAFVILIAIAQAVFVGIFVAAALSGDAWGIARAVALLLGTVYLLTTGPALILMWYGRVRSAAFIVSASTFLMSVAWWAA